MKKLLLAAGTVASVLAVASPVSADSTGGGTRCVPGTNVCYPAPTTAPTTPPTTVPPTTTPTTAPPTTTAPATPTTTVPATTLAPVTTVAPQTDNTGGVPAGGPQQNTGGDGGGGTDAGTSPTGGSPQANQAPAPSATQGTSSGAVSNANSPSANATAPATPTNTVATNILPTPEPVRAGSSFPWLPILTLLGVSGLMYLVALGRRREHDKDQAIEDELSSMTAEPIYQTDLVCPLLASKQEEKREATV